MSGSEVSLSGARRGRGRGRGRALLKPQINGTTSTTAAEDVVDGCVVRSTLSMQELSNRFSDNDSKLASTNPSSINGTIGTNVGKYQVPANNVDVPITVVSVKYDEKCAEIKFEGQDLSNNCKVRLYESDIMKKWKSENPLVFKGTTLQEKALLSSLEMNAGEHLVARKVIDDPDEGCLVVSIDVFGFHKLQQDFMSSLIYCLVPRLPVVDRNKIAVITNLRGDDEIDVIFHEEALIALREAIHAVQMERKLFQPRCPVIQQLYKEMIDGFNTHSFLAPLNDDWSELHRVKILGREQDFVKVLYIDIGKKCKIHLKDLSIPTLAKYVPDMIDKVPPQAVTLRVVNMKAKNSEILKTLKSVLEGRVCYVKTIDDLSIPPVVDVYISNSQGLGTVALSDLVTSISTSTVPPVANMVLKPDPLNAITKRLDGLVKNWKESSKKEIESNGYGQCECCKEKVLGVFEEISVPSVHRSVYSENACA